MKQNILFFLLLIYSSIAFGQMKNNSIQLSIGRSWHGTGDMAGVAVDISYDHALAKRLNFSNGITTTIHWKKDNGLNTPNNLNVTPDENLIRFTTAGIQLTSLLHYAVLYFPKHKINIDGGGILRFQSTSYPAMFGVHNHPEYWPQTFYDFNNSGNQNSFSAGYAFGLSYMAAVSKKYAAGLKCLFQYDTNGDAITQISLVLGRSLRVLK